MNQSFPKTQKLKSRKAIAQLFDEGKTVTKFPIKVFYLPQQDYLENKAAFAVPKRSFKLAVSRNRIKRQLREAYRLKKETLESNTSTKFALLFLYLGKTNVPYAQIEKAVTVLLKKLADENN